MNTLIKILKSRTTWMFILMFVVGGVNAVANFLPDGPRDGVLAVLGALGVYFKIKPSQNY